MAATDAESTLVMWPNQPTEIPDVFMSVDDSRITLKTQVNFAAEVSAQSAAELLLMTLNLERGDFELVREHWPAWASRYGLTSPGDAPDWMHGAGIYEVQIGTSYFWKDNPYCKYLEIRDLIADLTGRDIFPQDIYFLSSIPAHTHLSDLLIICTTAVALCLVAALVPAWFAARVDPAVALRDGG